MEYRLLGETGFKVPVLSLGTGTFGGSNDFFKAWGSTDADGARLLGRGRCQRRPLRHRRRKRR